MEGRGRGESSLSRLLCLSTTVSSVPQMRTLRLKENRQLVQDPIVIK